MASPKKLQATVTSVIRHSDKVIEYLFLPVGRIPYYKPGQFLHLAIDPYDPSKDWPDSRVFSIANAPEANRIRIVISIKGNFTARMATELMLGSTVWLKFPYGNFTFDHSGNTLVLIAGGTGISPYISYLEHCLAKKDSHAISLYYGVREEKYIIFNEMLEKCREALPSFNYTVYCEGDIKNKHQNILPGIIDCDQILKGNSKNSGFFISGPPLMIENIKRNLLDHEVLPGRIFIDEW
jgi:NAD(P)H-flavin reductase